MNPQTDNQVARTFLLEEQIVEEVYKAVTIDLAMMKGHIEDSLQAYGRDCWYLSDISLLKSTKREARDYLAKNSIAAGAAILTNSPISKMVGNLFLKFNKPEFPSKLFTDREKALLWIREQIELSKKV
ncbi:hypothetical protein SapgrDRAFT_0095 [Saprospira grandis DSM 2844]|uniref:DUF7793 domain-containing protein n=1 Tax=Saprospira grandis DSM 2844 TaxID=694433 RepID=J0NWH4_9BACT|nr:STAS/SEC14 domain-containing protein [Saprospira grandis]EJF51854.1 hypothetical protein SapgrDRAFT_0095 [Saprospira grandis DSM 2844]